MSVLDCARLCPQRERLVRAGSDVSMATETMGVALSLEVCLAFLPRTAALSRWLTVFGNRDSLCRKSATPLRTQLTNGIDAGAGQRVWLYHRCGALSVNAYPRLRIAASLTIARARGAHASCHVG